MTRTEAAGRDGHRRVHVMEVDRHRHWRVVARNHADLELRAPDGFEPIVEVAIAGREVPMIVHRVETSRAPDFPWTMLHSFAEPESEPVHHDDYFVFVLPDCIESVELRFRRKGKKRIGFSYGEVELPEPDDTTK